MGNKRNFAIKHLIYLFLFIVLFTTSYAVKAVDFERGQKTGVLIQNLELLKNSNGKIVEQKLIRIKSKWSDKIECYRIKHLSDGLKVVGFILKPKVEGHKFPVIIFNRGGNREYGKITEKTLRYLSYLSSNNYVVIASQYRGNDGGQGREEFWDKDIDDVLNLIPLAKSLQFTKPSKIVMIGYSRGGMMTYLAIKHGAKIKAAVVVSGITDLIQTYNERKPEMKRVIEDLVGFNRDEWKKRSAFYWPEKLNVPILILHGGNDWRVNVNQAKKLAKKLNKLGKTYELVVFPEGNHGLNKHRRERNRRIFEWFNRYLQQ
jgi:dipeptidyl aminopeptidase/acylaminoacyl peptidase